MKANDTMLIKYHALSGTLQKKSHGLYVLCGTDPYLLNDAAQQIKLAIKHHYDCSETLIDIQSPSDWSLLISEANSYSLFSEYVLLDARYEKKSIEVCGKELLSVYLKSINPRCHILLRAPMLTSKSLQWLANCSEVLIVQIYSLTPPLLKHWIVNQLHSKGLQVEGNVCELIYDYTQGNMLATAQCIERLSLCLNPGEIITPLMMREQFSDQSHFEVFDLSSACLDADPQHCLRLLQQFQNERIETTHILWILAQEIRLLIQLKHLLKQSVSFNEACQKLKIWSNRAHLYHQACQRLSTDELAKLLNTCQKLDMIIKTTQQSNAWHQLDSIALSLCGVHP